MEITITKDDEGNIIPVPNFFTCCRKGDVETLRALISGFKAGTLSLENLLVHQEDGSSTTNTSSFLSKIASFFYGGKASDASGTTNSASIFLTPHGKNRCFHRSPLHYACRFGHLACVKLLLDEIPHLQLSGETTAKWTILHECARFGHTSVLAYLFTNPRCEEILRAMCSKTTKFGSTPLHLCCKYGHTETAQYLTGQFIPYDRVNVSRNQNFLHVAIEEKMSTFVVDFLSKFIPTSTSNQLSRKIIVSIVELICSKDSFKTTSLHYASVRPSDQMYEALLRAITILHEYMENAGIVRSLVSPDVAGNTVLHYAMGGNSLKCALLVYHYYLLSIHRSNPNSIVNTTSFQKPTNQELLLSNNNPMNMQSGTMKHSPIFLACKYDHPSLLETFLLFYKDEHFEPNQENQKHIKILYENSPSLNTTSLYDFLRIKSKEEFIFVVQSWKQIKVTEIYDRTGHTPARTITLDYSDEELHDIFEKFNSWKMN
ncbi:hypothetical protein FDP41_012680 [Naegleria fowleri]|uniref:Uncharacterized protein n=1 Tax=Naegleria fowleri TaxID=5763 RepID=A0A6A5C2A5_NAEFO|nr:uncharacterized protein FDP41_012680 [Naegleria fowleri]KAF0980892.1 hypothetical protein FDP41_012680 [Naegleria fowleri]CAG4717217.1 unnamed protein product [Naegleria fowleri]